MNSSDTPATDRPSSVTIQVTEEDIKFGRRRSPCTCPVARALRRTFKDKWHGNIYVDGRRAQFVSYDWQVADFKIILPDEVSVKILEYDHACPMKPFTFELPLCTAS